MQRTVATNNAVNAEAIRQNIFGVKVIAWSTFFVGLGITVLGCIAENGKVAAMVGIVIIFSALVVINKQRKAALTIEQ
jgi:SSS family solute:Na+ symporter